MIKISVDENLADLSKLLEGVEERRWPFLVSYAANKTGQDVKTHIQQEMPKYIDRPKPYSINSMFVKTGNKQNPEAEVRWKDPAGKSQISAGKYLVPQALGGGRTFKAFEVALRATNLVPPGYFVVPSDEVPVDQYGNVSGGYIRRMLSALKASRTSSDPTIPLGKRPKRSRNRSLAFFTVQPGQSNILSPGIYERSKQNGLRAVFWFVRSVQYQKRFPFYELSEKRSRIVFPEKIAEAIQRFVLNK